MSDQNQCLYTSRQNFQTLAKLLQIDCTTLAKLLLSETVPYITMEELGHLDQGAVQHGGVHLRPSEHVLSPMEQL